MQKNKGSSKESTIGSPLYSLLAQKERKEIQNCNQISEQVNSLVAPRLGLINPNSTANIIHQQQQNDIHQNNDSIKDLSSKDKDRRNPNKQQEQIQTQYKVQQQFFQKLVPSSLDKSSLDVNSISFPNHTHPPNISLISNIARNHYLNSSNTQYMPDSLSQTQSQPSSKSESLQGLSRQEQKQHQLVQQQNHPQQQQQSYQKISQSQQKLQAMLVEPRGAGILKSPTMSNSNGNIQAKYISISKSFNQNNYSTIGKTTTATTTNNNNMNSSNTQYNNYLSISQKASKTANHERTQLKSNIANLSNHPQIYPSSQSSPSSYLQTLQEYSPFRKTRQSLEVKPKSTFTEGSHTSGSSKNRSSLQERNSISPQANHKKDNYTAKTNEPSRRNNKEKSQKNNISSKTISNGYFSLSSYNNNMNQSRNNKSSISPSSSSSAGIARSKDTSSVKSSQKNIHQLSTPGVPNCASILLQQSPSQGSHIYSQVYTPLHTLLSSHPPQTTNGNATQMSIQQAKEKIMRNKQSPSQSHQKNSKSESINKNHKRSNTKDHNNSRNGQNHQQYHHRHQENIQFNNQNILDHSQQQYSISSIPQLSPNNYPLKPTQLNLSPQGKISSNKFDFSKFQASSPSGNSRTITSTSSRIDQHANNKEKVRNHLISKTNAISGRTHLHENNSSSLVSNHKIDDSVVIHANLISNQTALSPSSQYPIAINLPELSDETHLDEFLQENRFSLDKKKEYFECLVKTLREASLQSKIKEQNLYSISNITPTRTQTATNQQQQLLKQSPGYSNGTQIILPSNTQQWKLLDKLVEAIEIPIEKILEDQACQKNALNEQKKRFEELLQCERDGKIELIKRVRETQEYCYVLENELNLLKQSSEKDHSQILSKDIQEQKNHFGGISINNFVNPPNSSAAAFTNSKPQIYDTSSMSETSSDVLSLCANDLHNEAKISETLKDKLKINLSSLNQAVLGSQNANRNVKNNIHTNNMNSDGQNQQFQDIYGYHDEFMNKFDEFSQSWRDAIIAEQRYPSDNPQPVAHIQMKNQ